MRVKPWKAILIAVILLASIGAYFARKETVPSTTTAAPAGKPVPAPESQHASAPAAVVEPPPAAERPESPTPPPRSEESRAASRRYLENPLVSSYPATTPPPRKAADSEPDIAADFDRISLMFRDYRTLTNENPVGTNSEIMKAIMGENPKGARLGPPEGFTLNENGELLDHWGTPYFFHQLTSDLMEIRSAGPDRRMWNDDDLIGD